MGAINKPNISPNFTQVLFNGDKSFEIAMPNNRNIPEIPIK